MSGKIRIIYKATELKRSEALQAKAPIAGSIFLFSQKTKRAGTIGAIRAPIAGFLVFCASKK